MDHESVLEMPCRRFWLMERNITRIQAHCDLRSMRVAASTVNSEQNTKLRDLLLGEQGQVYRFDRTADVAPEPGAISRLKSLAG